MTRKEMMKDLKRLVKDLGKHCDQIDPSYSKMRNTKYGNLYEHLLDQTFVADDIKSTLDQIVDDLEAWEFDVPKRFRKRDKVR